MAPRKIADLQALDVDRPAHVRVANVDLVVLRDADDAVSVLYGRCQHRGALLADGTVRGDRLRCGLHGSTYDRRTGVNVRPRGADLQRFEAWVDEGGVWVDEEEISDWERRHPQQWRPGDYQGLYQDPKGTEDEPRVGEIQRLAADGLERVGHHGPVAAMGVPRSELPTWDDLQLLTAQLHRAPLLDDAPVGTDVVIGPAAERPLRLDIPLLVSDMSFGALSEEAKVALAIGADRAGTGICSGEGGLLDEEQQANRRELYELASARFGFTLDTVARCQAFHFKLGQAAKTGTGGHLPGHKVRGRIAEVRGLADGTAAISPARFPDLTTTDDFRAVAAEVREATDGIPIGVKLSAQHVERDLAAMQAIGCLGMRACHTDRCPVGIATQDPALRSRLPVEQAADRLARFLGASVELLQVLARACGHEHLADFHVDDLVTWKRDVADLAGVAYGGVGDSVPA